MSGPDRRSGGGTAGQGGPGPRIRLALNTVTIKPTPFPDKLRLISQAGFRGIGLWMEDIEHYMRSPGSRPIRELLEQYELVPVEMQLIRKWQYLEGAERERAFEEARSFMARVRDLGVQCPVVALPSEGTGEIEAAVEDFRRMCQIAGDFGLSVAFEFIGWAEQFNNIRAAWEVVGGAGCANGGILLDTFHFVKAGSRIEDLEEVPADKIYLVHVNDMKSLPVPTIEQSRRFRFLPGEGEAPLRQIMGCLMRNGYEGFYCCEIFNETHWAEDPELFLGRCMKSMQDLLDAARGG
jgi:sugar phosphate isomerase/epimerase